MMAESEADKKVARVLLVDDHPIVLDGLAQLINREEQLEVCGGAATTAEALKLVASEKPDIVVTDLVLAEGSGLDLIKELKVRYPSLPVLVLSVRDESVYAERVLRAGARGYVMKDEAGDRIREGLLRVLDGEIYLSETMAREMLSKLVNSRDTGVSVPEETLSDRELQVFELTGQGLGTTRIAEKLHLSPKTIETYRAKIKEKLHLQDATDLRRHAIQWVQSQGLV